MKNFCKISKNNYTGTGRVINRFEVVKVYQTPESFVDKVSSSHTFKTAALRNNKLNINRYRCFLIFTEYQDPDLDLQDILRNACVFSQTKMSK